MQKKADVTKRPQAFLHVGLLINKHDGLAIMSFDMSSEIQHHQADVGFSLIVDGRYSFNENEPVSSRKSPERTPLGDELDQLFYSTAWQASCKSDFASDTSQ